MITETVTKQNASRKVSTNYKMNWDTNGSIQREANLSKLK